MSRPSERLHHAQAATELGPDPADPSAAITVPDSALGGGCYLEGGDADLRGALLDSWCVQWAEAGYGFCYVNPGGTVPRELVERLPAHRLDDVVWIDVDRTRPEYRNGVPVDRRVTVDIFDAPQPDPSTYAVDPVNNRVNAYLDAFSEHPAFDWNAARVLSSALPAVLVRGDVSHADVTRALESKGLDEVAEYLEGTAGETEGRRALAVAQRAMDGVLDRAGSPASDAAWLLDRVADSNPADLLVGPGSYDVGRAIMEDDIVVVTGDAVRPGDGEPTDDVARLRTHLLVAALCCRLHEAAAFAPPDAPMFPLVLDGFGDLLAGEGDVFQRLLRTSYDLPLAPIFSGPRPAELPEPLALAVGDHVATRIAVADETDPDPEPDFDPVEDPYLESALGPGSVDVVGAYLEREGLRSLPEAPLAWCRVNAIDRAAGVFETHDSIQPAIVPRRPEALRPPEEVAAVVARSVDRHGTAPTEGPSDSA
jgi:hypothetical protein